MLNKKANFGVDAVFGDLIFFHKCLNMLNVDLYDVVDRFCGFMNGRFDRFIDGRTFANHFDNFHDRHGSLLVDDPNSCVRGQASKVNSKGKGTLLALRLLVGRYKLLPIPSAVRLEMRKNKTPFTYSKRPERQELKYYGLYACLKLWESRPEDVIRVYVEQRHVKQVGPLLKWCASKGKAYHIVSPEELAKVSDSVHHEGLCILAREQPSIAFAEMLDKVNSTKEPVCLLYLDGVQNPHNIGSIMRVCAHFGVPYILGEKTLLPKVSPSAYRVAQGGAEYVGLVPLDNVKQSFQKLAQMGFRAVASSSHGGKALYTYSFAARTLIVMGSESEGVNKKLLESTKDTLLIPGTNVVESLNVSVATGLFLGEYWRQLRST